ncbi:MAG: threonine--tRNA ligase [Deltaproteobacteria bacterium]|nr:threonine--tRNA ligase [Deltaproteobacteria bacterium]
MENPEARFINVELPDGSRVRHAEGTTPLQVALSISGGLARAAVAARVDDRLVDLTVPLTADASVKILTFTDREGVEVFRHTSAHLLAQAVVQLFPDARPTIGPPVDEGFYYDFDHAPFSENDLERIEARMIELAAMDQRIERVEMTREAALAQFTDNRYKVEMIQDLPEGQISAYRQGDFIDLCRGPHLPSTGAIKAIKVLKVAGAYWRGDARNPQLQRIYAITFPKKEMLKQHMEMLEEAKLRDHRKLGRELDLFSFHEEGPGFPFWHDNGMILKEEVVRYWRSVHRREGYAEISTPLILDESLWHRSGHWDHYKKNMYFTSIDERPFAVKPMNCPGGLLVFTSGRHSYRDLPARLAELGTVHRHEMSGVLHGLFRVRCFTQDDAHIYCTEDQLPDEVIGVVRLVFEIYKTFGFSDVRVELSTRPEGRIGSDEVWDRAEGALEHALKNLGIAYELNPGDGAFYGPKIDFHIRDCMGRSWQCGTVQVDFSMPSEERFNAFYEAPDGKRHPCVMVHRAILGSLERFIGIMLEHHAGKLPLWLSPRQVCVLPIAEAYLDYAKSVATRLREAGLRVRLDDRNETVGKKVREAQLDRFNYQAVVGQREAEQDTVSIRTRGNRQLGAIPVAEFVARCQAEIASREISGE